MPPDSPPTSRRTGPWIALTVALVALVAAGLWVRNHISGLQAELAEARRALQSEESALSSERSRAEDLQGTLDRVGSVSRELMASLEEIQRLTGTTPEAPDITAGLEAPATMSEAMPDVAAAGEPEASVSEGPVDEASDELPPEASSGTVRQPLAPGAPLAEVPSVLEPADALDRPADADPSAEAEAGAIDLRAAPEESASSAEPAPADEPEATSAWDRIRARARSLAPTF